MFVKGATEMKPGELLPGTMPYIVYMYVHMSFIQDTQLSSYTLIAFSLLAYQIVLMNSHWFWYMNIYLLRLLYM